MHNTIMHMYVASVGNYHTKGSDNSHLLTDNEIIVSNGFLSPDALIRLSRVSLFIRVVRKRSTYVLGLINAMAERKN